ncbi:phage tail tape measure protein [Curtobacterium sp. NPDC090217]|uniref:phage tail tape measure protein n=1 Tax=Curtobacterium sp. NPDC090217 TaxID=3363970 RepID=UPI003817CD95
MANRTVKTSLVAEVNGYISGMQSAARATRELGTENEKLAQKREALSTLATGVGVIGTVAAASLGLAVAKSAEFSAQLSKVQAATGAGAIDMGKYREQALSAGVAFGYTASQVTEAQIELGKAGLATRDILGGGLTGVLALAASDNVELGKATQIASVAMKQFNLEGKDVPHIADLLAAGAGKALGGVEQLGDALNQSGLVASNFGFSLEETTGVLSAFADAGLLGSDAGTSLKSALQALANPSKQSADLMKSLGINVKDSNGQFLGAADLAEHLRERLGGLTDAQRQQALAQIFGSDAVRAATVLYKEAGDGIQKYIDQNNDAGYAVEQARIKNDNLVGDLKKLQSAFEGALIRTGSSADTPLRALVQTTDDLVTSFNNAPPALQATSLGVLAVVAAVGLGGAAFLGIVPKIAATKVALETLGVTGASVRGRLGGIVSFLGGPWGIAMLAATAAVVSFNMVMNEGRITQDELINRLSTSEDALKNFAAAAQQGSTSKTFLGSYKDELKDLPGLLKKATGNGVDDFLNLTFRQQGAVTSIKKYGDALASVANSDLPRAQKQFAQLADSQNLSAGQQTKLLNLMSGYKNELTTQATQLGLTADKQTLLALATGDYTPKMQAAIAASQESKGASDGAATGMDGVADSAEDAAQAVDQVAKALAGLTSPTLDARQAQRQFEAALDSVGEAIKSNKDAYKDAGTSLDIATEEGRKNQEVLDGIASSAQDVASKLFTQTGSQDQATAAMQRGRDELVKALEQYGITGQAAEDYANEIIGTPTQWATVFQNNATGQPLGDVATYTGSIYGVPNAKETQLKAEIAQATQNLQNLKNQIGNVPAAKETELRAQIAAAEANLRALKGQLDGIQSKSVTITANYVYNNLRTGDGTPGNGLGVMKADGGVVDYYADGAIRGSENHVAEIAPGGAWRVWAEPETGGEAYIPLAPSKRSRSLAIWEETGRRLQAFADGGTYGEPTYVPTPPQVVYAQSPAASGSSGGNGSSSVFAPSFVSSGSTRRDMEEARWAFDRYESKRNGGR